VLPTAENTAIVTPTAGACKTGFALTELGAEGKEGKAARSHARIPTSAHNYADVGITMSESGY
jgi:hypothetical protein